MPSLGFQNVHTKKLEKNQGVELWRPQLCRKPGLPGAPQRAGGKASLSSSASDLPECTPQTPSLPPHAQMFHFAEFLPWMMDSLPDTLPQEQVTACLAENNRLVLEADSRCLSSSAVSTGLCAGVPMIISFQNSFTSNMPSSTVCFNRQPRWLTSLRWVPEGTCRKIFPQPNPRLHSLLPSCLASQTNTLRWACEYWYTGQSNGWEKSPYLVVLSLGGEKEEKKVRTSHFFLKHSFVVS